MNSGSVESCVWIIYIRRMHPLAVSNEWNPLEGLAVSLYMIKVGMCLWT